MKNRKIFSQGALEALFRVCGGYPRRINVLCDHALLTGFVRGVQVINTNIIEECAAGPGRSGTISKPLGFKSGPEAA